MTEEYVTKLQLKPHEHKDGQKYKVIELTDFQVHTTKHPPTKSVGRKVAKAFINDTSGRFYYPTTGNLNKDVGDFLKHLYEDPSFIEFVQKEEKDGYKVLLQLPKKGTPLKAGNDAKQFLESKKGKRVLRGLAKRQTD